MATKGWAVQEANLGRRYPDPSDDHGFLQCGGESYAFQPCSLNPLGEPYVWNRITGICGENGNGAPLEP